MNFKEGRQTLNKVIDKYKYDMGHIIWQETLEWGTLLYGVVKEAISN